MAVAVVDATDLREPHGVHPRLFAQLTSGGGRRRFAPFDLSARELPETREQSTGGPPLDEPPTLVLQDDDGGAEVRPGRSWRAGRQTIRRVELEVRTAPLGHRAHGAPRCSGAAHGLAELHDRFVESARIDRRQVGVQEPPEITACPRRTRVPFEPVPAGEHPHPVRLEGGDLLAEREAGDRPRDVRPETRQLLELGPAPGPDAPPFADQDPGRLQEPMGAGVIAGAFPDLEDRADRRGRQPLEVGEAFEEAPVVRDGLSDAGLLEQDLRDPDPVGIAVGPPRERTPVRPEPVEQRAGPLGRRFPVGSG